MEENPALASQEQSTASPGVGPSRPATAKRRSGRGRISERSGGSRIGLPEPEYLNLGDAQEDVVEAAPAPEAVQSLSPESAPISQPSEKVYVQEVAGFRKAQRQQYEQSIIERQRQAAGEIFGPENGYNTAAAIQTGIVSQNIFRMIAVALQGLLAGFTIAHCLMVMFDTPPYYSNAHFINHYSPLALPAHCLYYVVLVICTLAALDRYDVGQSFLRVTYRAFTFQSGGLACICYFAATAVNQVSIAVEERMTLFYRNSTASAVGISERQQYPLNEMPWMDTDMQLWKGCLIAKAVLVTVAWVMIAVRPGTDLLVKHMRHADAQFAKEFETPKAEQNVAAGGTTDGN